MIQIQNLKIKVLFLYTELAEYFISCLRCLSENDVEIHVVRWQVNKEAPFEFSHLPTVKFYNRESYDYDNLKHLADTVKPDIIVCSGWIDKLYLKICAHFYGKAKTVLTLDNQWKGGWKQQLARLVSPFYLKTKFSHVWVPGKRQVEYARKINFLENRILTGFYCADISGFEDIYQKTKKHKQENFPKRLLYVGRYTKSKGIFDLWDAFIELIENGYEDWELWCFGTGDEYDNRKQHQNIKHHGFVQPNELQNYLDQVGVFVLPSHFEPWGVVIHEMAAAGFPIIASNAVGAADQFVKNGINGFVYQQKEAKGLKNALQKIMDRPLTELVNMGDRSNEFALELTPQKWVDKLMSIK